MSLRKLLKNFCREALREMESIGELPYPPFKSPVIAEDISITYRLSELESYKVLQSFMRESGITKQLQDTGHTWFWHEEVFEWLFLERLVQETRGTIFDQAAFDRVYKLAQSELSRPHFRFKRITIINGAPRLSRPIKISPDITLEPAEFKTAHFRLADLLDLRYQDRNRPISTWGFSDSCFLVQDRLINKGDDGRELLDYFDRTIKQSNEVITAFRLATTRPILPKAVFTSYISRFPLLPVTHTEIEENRDVSYSAGPLIERAEERAIRPFFEFIDQVEAGAREEPQYFVSALQKFSSSFRVRQIEQNIVDLIVALESLFSVQAEELRRRLATVVALSLGVNDRERKDIYHKVFAGYQLRNAVVHGQQKPSDVLVRAIIRFYPHLKGRSAEEISENLWIAVRELREIVRKALRAYIYMRTRNDLVEWPKVEDIEELQFDPHKLRDLHKHLGIKANSKS